MNKITILILLLTGIAHAQVATICENRVVNIPRLGAADPVTGRVISIPYNGPNTQVIRICRPAPLPTQNTVQIPEAERQQLQQLQQR